VALDDRQAVEYSAIQWQISTGPVGVIHRLMIAPSFAGRGLSKVLMQLVEAEARRRGYRSLRLDAFLANPAALRLYAGLGYRRAGEVQFRKGMFACFEKQICDAVLP
jgi:GNAT superfamily N-acetyltransferase